MTQQQKSWADEVDEEEHGIPILQNINARVGGSSDKKDVGFGVKLFKNRKGGDVCVVTHHEELMFDFTVPDGCFVTDDAVVNGCCAAKAYPEEVCRIAGFWDGRQNILTFSCNKYPEFWLKINTQIQI